MAAPIPVLHFDTKDFPESERFDVWRAGITTHQVTRREIASARFDAVVDAWTLGEMVITHSRIGAARLVRTAGMAREDGRDWIQVVFLKSGTVTFSIDDDPLERTMRQGELAAFDTLRGLVTDGSAMDCITCTISRRAFERSGFDPSIHHGRVIDGAWGRLIADYLLSFVQRLADMNADDAANLTVAFVGLLTTALRARQANGDAAIGKSAASLRQRAEAYIDQHLTSDKMTIKSISQNLAASQSNLYRAFANTGGVTAYVRKRRLEAIHACLNAGEPLAIGDIARQYGFVSAAHFSRAFRKQFGFSPRSARLGTIGPPTVEDTDEVTLFRHWEEQLR